MAKNGKAPTEIQEAGFELEGQFYPWYVSDTGRDGLLIDRISGGMTMDAFFEAANDEHERMRTPILLGLIATSIRNAHPTWTVERIVRIVNDVHLGDIEYLAGDAEEEEPKSDIPPTGADEASPESSSTLKESQGGKSRKSSAIPA